VIKHIFSYEGDVLIRTEEAEPICGEDFCDSCGDCLACYGDEPCFYNALGHYWVKYEELPKKASRTMKAKTKAWVIVGPRDGMKSGTVRHEKLTSWYALKNRYNHLSRCSIRELKHRGYRCVKCKVVVLA